MDICVTSSNSVIESPVSVVFGRCLYFLIFDEKGKLKETISNEAIGSMRGAGVAAAQIVISKGADILITGNIGPNALMVLQQSKIKVYQGAGMSVKQALEALKENKLTELKTAVRGFKGPGAGRGFGRGRR